MNQHQATERTGAAAVDFSAGAAYAGLNFFPPSPRYVSPAEARALALATPEGLAKVGLVVEAGDDLLDEIVEAVPVDQEKRPRHQ